MQASLALPLVMSLVPAPVGAVVGAHVLPGAQGGRWPGGPGPGVVVEALHGGHPQALVGLPSQGAGGVTCILT